MGDIVHGMIWKCGLSSDMFAIVAGLREACMLVMVGWEKQEMVFDEMPERVTVISWPPPSRAMG